MTTNLEAHRMKLRMEIGREIKRDAFNDLVALWRRSADRMNKTEQVHDGAIFDILLEQLINIGLQMPTTSKAEIIEFLELALEGLKIERTAE